MADLLSTSVSGLLAFQQALDVTSNNISNAATPGYSVETANLAEAPGQYTGAGYIGSGVNVQSVTRAYNAQLTQQVRTSQSSYSSYNTLATQAQQIDNMLSDSSTGISASLQAFVNALQSVSTSPTSTSARQALLNQGQALAQQLQNYDTQIGQYGSQLESQISGDVSQINTLATNIANLNQQIAAATAGGQSPNQLMDQRGTLIDKLSKYVSVQTVTQANGATDVYIGNGQALVNGAVAQQLTTIPGAYDPTQLDVGMQSSTGVTNLTTEMTGGELGGLLSARSQVLNPTRNAIGRISVALATIVNQQQQSGMTLNGTPGQPMFTVGGVQVLPDSSNTASAAVTVTRTSLSQLTTDNYQLQYTGGGWQLTDLTTGQQVAMHGTGTSTSPFQAAGMSLIVSGTPGTNDSFLVSPTGAATAGLTMQLTDPSQIAAASLVQASAASANTGTGTISTVGVTNAASYVSGTYTVSFSSPTQYTVTTGSPATVVTSGTYTSGTPITFNGQQITLNGSPAAGDTFTVQPNSTANTGDNSNVLAMINGLSSKSLAGGTASVNDAATNLISQVGALTQAAQNNASAQQSINQEATTARSNATGVNLDQQAADMLRYQQAYQAMAQVISMSNQMFTSLIQAVG
ncbi:MAG: flagellar hook-associated protein FlgK [Steroidobacteraceae bacterium]